MTHDSLKIEMTFHGLQEGWRALLFQRRGCIDHQVTFQRFGSRWSRKAENFGLKQNTIIRYITKRMAEILYNIYICTY